MMDIIEVFTENGMEKMEVVLTYKLDNNDYNYIIYKSLNGEHYYVGKYTGDNIVSIDTNLTDKEMVLAENILGGIKNNG